MFIQKAITKHCRLCIFFISPIFFTFLLPIQLSAALTTNLQQHEIKQPRQLSQAQPRQRRIVAQERRQLRVAALLQQEEGIQEQLEATRQQLEEERLLGKQQQQNIQQLQRVLEQEQLLMHQEQERQKTLQLESEKDELELKLLIIQLQQLQEEQQLMLQTILKEEENNLD